MTLLLFPACASSGEVDIVDTADKEDGSWVVRADPGYRHVGLLCPAATGCKATITFDFTQLGADPADLSVLIGRSENDLKEAGSVVVNGSAELVIEIDEPPTDSVPASSLDHDPAIRLLALIQLADENPVEYQLTHCMQDQMKHSEYFPEEVTKKFTIHDATDTDVFTFEVVDDPSFVALPLQGHIIEIERISDGLSAESDTTATYTCKSDGEVLEFELTRAILDNEAGDLSFGLNPDCKGLDDSGTVTITVNDPKANSRRCPGYFVYSEVQADYL